MIPYHSLDMKVPVHPVLNHNHLVLHWLPGHVPPTECLMNILGQTDNNKERTTNKIDCPLNHPGMWVQMLVYPVFAPVTLTLTLA